MNQGNYNNPYGNYGTPYTPYGNVNPSQNKGQQQGQQQGYQQPMSYPSQQPQMPPVSAGGSQGSGGPQVPGMLPVEESYIENILRLNKGKLATVYTTFENNKEWNAKIFKGIIEAAGRDHLILSDPQTGVRYLIPMVYLDYVTFEEEIEYEYPYGGGANLASYPPR